jgi:hypothetical protein
MAWVTSSAPEVTQKTPSQSSNTRARGSPETRENGSAKRRASCRTAKCARAAISRIRHGGRCALPGERALYSLQIAIQVHLRRVLLEVEPVDLVVELLPSHVFVPPANALERGEVCVIIAGQSWGQLSRTHLKRALLLDVVQPAALRVLEALRADAALLLQLGQRAIAV